MQNVHKEHLTFQSNKNAMHNDTSSTPSPLVRMRMRMAGGTKERKRKKMERGKWKKEGKRPNEELKAEIEIIIHKSDTL